MVAQLSAGTPLAKDSVWLPVLMQSSSQPPVTLAPEYPTLCLDAVGTCTDPHTNTHMYT